jgi:hypothetical protein
MTGKFIILTLILGSTVDSLMAQELKYERIYPFNDEKFQERLNELNHFKSDSLLILNDTLSANINNKYPMRILELQGDKMAGMPMMNINKDLHYTMPIKNYDSFNIHKSEKLEQDSIFRRKGLPPLLIPKEK